MRFHLALIKKLSFIRFIPELLIFTFFLIVGFYHHIIYDFSPFVYYGTIFMSFIIITLYVYVRLYRWRNLSLSISSFIFFSINIVQLILYLFAISVLFNMYYYDKFHPIYLDDLSIISRYRYLILCIISFFFIIFLILCKVFGFALSSFSYPHLKEEVRKILYSWNDSLVGDCCLKITKYLLKSKIFRITFITLDVLLFYVFRIIIISIFISFCFFNGDLQYLLYLSPISFFIWILSFYSYYYSQFIFDNTIYIQNILIVKLQQPISVKESKLPIIDLVNKQLIFTLTEEGVNDGFVSADLPILAIKWKELALINSFFYYQRDFKYIFNFLVIIQMICWFYLSYVFFGNTYIVFSTSPWFVVKRAFSFTKPLLAPRDARFVKEPFQNALKTKTGNEFPVGHPVFGEVEKDGSYRTDGSLTHGAHGEEILGHNFYPEASDQRPINAKAFTESVKAPTSWFSPPIKGSEGYLESAPVKERLDNMCKKPSDSGIE